MKQAWKVLGVWGLLVSGMALASDVNYQIKPGKLHKKGTVTVSVRPDLRTYVVDINYHLKKKSMVPVPDSLLSGKKTMEFPPEFRTEQGYKNLEKNGTVDIPKARLHFVRRVELTGAKGAGYLLEVKPTNKKSKLAITYHPSLPGTGWQEVRITLLSALPVVDGYEIIAIKN